MGQQGRLPGTAVPHRQPGLTAASPHFSQRVKIRAVVWYVNVFVNRIFPQPDGATRT
jgi:hypothetical protein